MMNTLIQLQNLLLPLSLFTLLATATPGPNNLLLTLSGSQYGMRRTLPFIFGIRLGITGLFIVMGLGVGAVIFASPSIYLTLKLVGASYLVYLTLKVGFTKSHIESSMEVNLIGLKKGVFLQFVNPKAMMMVLSCITTFSLPGELYSLSVLHSSWHIQ